MKRLLLGISLLVGLHNGCVFSGCDIIRVSAEDKDWLEPYTQIDTLIFKNPKGMRHIFTISRLDTLLSPCNKIELSEYQYESCIVKFKCNNKLSTHMGELDNFSLSIYAKRQEDSISKKVLRIFDFKTSFYQIDPKVENDSLYFHPLKKDVKTYFYDLGSYSYPNDTIESVRSVHYSKEYGLMRYTTIRDTFKLVKIK